MGQCYPRCNNNCHFIVNVIYFVLGYFIIFEGIVGFFCKGIIAGHGVLNLNFELESYLRRVKVVMSIATRHFEKYSVFP